MTVYLFLVKTTESVLPSPTHAVDFASLHVFPCVFAHYVPEGQT